MRKPSWWIVALAFTLLVPAIAVAALTKSGGASVAFVATGPAGLKIEGKTSDLDVSEADGKVKIGVPLANVDTGIALRNKHMRDKYLEVAKFPRAELTVDRGSLKFPADGAEASGTATGQMTIHGQTKPVTVTYSARLAGGTFAVSGGTKINIKDFGIDVPSYLGVTVKPDVEIVVRFAVTDR